MRLTDACEARLREDIDHGVPMMPDDAGDIFDTLDALRAELAEQRELLRTAFEYAVRLEGATGGLLASRGRQFSDVDQAAGQRIREILADRVGG